MPWQHNDRRYMDRMTAAELNEAHEYNSEDLDDDNWTLQDAIDFMAAGEDGYDSKGLPTSSSVPPQAVLADFFIEDEDEEEEKEAPEVPPALPKPELVQRVQTDEEVYRAVPRWEQPEEEVDSKQQDKKKPKAVLTKCCDPQEFCDDWHASSFFVGYKYRVNMKKETRSFALEVVEGSVKLLPVVESVSQEDSEKTASLLVRAMDTSGVKRASSMDGYGLFQQWIACRPTMDQLKTKDEGNSASTSCMICFSDCTGNYVPSYCGHVVCKDCQQSYLDVTCRNAERVHLACPAEKCPATIDLLESSFLIGNEQELWKRLVDTELDWFAAHDCQGFYCPNHFCSALLVRETPLARETPPNTPSKKGKDALVCHGCYQPVCTDCLKPAHLGMNCDQATRIEKVLARMDEAALNLEYITRYTKPCPKCSYGITKVDGCNHMRCNHCQYYFCWMCGGYGNDCNAYRCFNPADKDWWKKDSNIPSEINSIENDADRYKSHLHDLSVYRATERNMNVLQRLFKGGEESTAVDDEVISDALQVQYVMIMTRRWKLYHQESNKYQKCKRIDLLLSDLDALATVYWERLGRQHKQLVRSPARHLKQLKAAAAAAEKGPEADTFDAIVRKEERKDMSRLKSKSLHARSLEVTRRMLSFLLQNVEGADKKKSKSTVEGVAEEFMDNSSQTAPIIEPLNVREKRINHGWKKSDDEDNESSNNDNQNSTDVRSWKKTKERTNRQRRHHLGEDL